MRWETLATGIDQTKQKILQLPIRDVSANINRLLNEVYPYIDGIPSNPYTDIAKYLVKQGISLIHAPFRIANDENLNELFSGSLKQNFYYALIPLVLIRIIDKYILFNEGDEVSNKFLRKILFYITLHNTIINIFYVIAISGSSANTQPKSKRCADCRFSLSSEIILNLNYIAGFKLNTLLIQQLPLGTFQQIAWYYTAYSYGNGLLDYPLSTDGVCADHRETTNNLIALILGGGLLTLNQTITRQLHLSADMAFPIEKLLFQLYIVAIHSQAPPPAQSVGMELIQVQPIPKLIQRAVSFVAQKLKERARANPPNLLVLNETFFYLIDTWFVKALLYALLPELIHWDQIHAKLIAPAPPATNKSEDLSKSKDDFVIIREDSAMLAELVGLYPISFIWNNCLQSLNKHIETICQIIETNSYASTSVNIATSLPNQSAALIKWQFNIPLSLTKMLLNYINEFPDTISALRTFQAGINHYTPPPSAIIPDAPDKDKKDLQTTAAPPPPVDQQNNPPLTPDVTISGSDHNDSSDQESIRDREDSLTSETTPSTDGNNSPQLRHDSESSDDTDAGVTNRSSPRPDLNILFSDNTDTATTDKSSPQAISDAASSDNDDASIAVICGGKVNLFVTLKNDNGDTVNPDAEWSMVPKAKGNKSNRFGK